MKNTSSYIDFSVLVDIISNVAGMMIMLACIALVVRQDRDGAEALEKATKPITYPLAYIPDKRSVTICLKNNQLYRLPERAGLETMITEASKGKAVHFVDITKDGVEMRLEVTPTATGYRFLYSILDEGGVPLDQSAKIADALRLMKKQFPPDRFFFVIHTWPEEVSAFVQIREFLHEEGVEVGWMPRTHDESDFDIMYSIGEYSTELSSIKAQ